MVQFLKVPALAAAAGLLAVPGAASAIPAFGTASQGTVANGVETTFRHGRDRHYGDNYYGGYGRQRVYYDEPVYRDTRVWRGRDGRYYCRKRNGTTGLIIGGAIGALLGREIDGGYHRTTGTILGAAGGALLGRAIDRDRARCR